MNAEKTKLLMQQLSSAYVSQAHAAFGGLISVALRDRPTAEALNIAEGISSGQSAAYVNLGWSAEGGTYHGKIVDLETGRSQELLSGVFKVGADEVPETEPTELSNVEAIDHLGRALAALASAQVPDPDALEWLVGGLKLALIENKSLDAALGLARAGSDTPRRQAMIYARNQHLYRAFEELDQVEGQTFRQKCVELAARIKQFMQRDWPRAKKQPDADAGWPRWKKALFLAARMDVRMPESANGVANILEKLVKPNAGYSVNAAGVKVISDLVLSHNDAIHHNPSSHPKTSV